MNYKQYSDVQLYAMLVKPKSDVDLRTGIHQALVARGVHVSKLLKNTGTVFDVASNKQ